METIDDLLCIREALPGYPIKTTVHVQGDFLYIHELLHEKIMKEFLSDLWSPRSFHQSNELSRILVRQDGVELSFDEGCLINGHSRSEIFREEEFSWSSGRIVARELILVRAFQSLGPIQSPDAFDLHWFAFDLLLLKKQRSLS